MSAVKEAALNRSEHRKNISSALSYIKQNRLVRERHHIQYFNAGSEIRETIVGIAACMLLGSGGIRSDIPIIAFAKADDGVKVSARADRSLAERGLDLSVIMRKASETVGGYGGGHSVAAGATIPEGTEERFLDAVEDMVAAQII
jgi:RecJ-like exonuclease